MRNIGNAQDAMDYALDVVFPAGNEGDTFLRSWREGDLSEWPEYFTWLAARYAA